MDSFHVLSEDVFCFTFAEHLRLDGGFKGESVLHFTNLLEDVFHLLRIGKELLLLTVLLDGDHTAVFALRGLDTHLEVADYDGQVYQFPDAYHRSGETLLAVIRLVSYV